MAVRRGLFFLPVALAIGAVLLLAPSQALAQTSLLSETEPNNSTTTANRLPLTTVALDGQTNQTGDLDFYSIDLVDGNLIRIALTGLRGGFDGRIQLLNEFGVVIDEIARTGNTTSISLNTPITAASPPGPGFVRISNDVMDVFNLVFNYQLTIAQGKPEIEPNNTPVTAQPMGVDFPILGTYPSQDPFEEDYFTFNVPAAEQSATVGLEFRLDTDVQLAIELSDPNGVVLASAQRTNVSGSSGAKNPSIVKPLPPGDYVVRVRTLEATQQSISVPYSLFVRLATGLYEFEPNQSFAEAVPVEVNPGSSGTVIGGSLQTGQDVDVYSFDVPAGQTVIADTDGLGDFVVLDSVVSTFVQVDQGLPFASGDNSSVVPQGATFPLVNRDGYVRVVPTVGGTVYVGVGDRQNRGNPEGFDYQLTLKVVAPEDTEGEPNDDAATALPVVNGQVIRGTIGDDGDVDLFTIQGTVGDTLAVNLNAFGIGSFLDARVRLLDPSGVELIDADRSAFSIDPFIILASLNDTGTYSIEVKRRQGAAGSGPSYYYELIIRSEPTQDATIANPDIDGTGRVDGWDLVEMARAFGTTKPLTPDPDFDRIDIFKDAMNIIDGFDLSALANFFGVELPPLAQAGLLVDTIGDSGPFFGPATDLADVVGLSSAIVNDPNQPEPLIVINTFFAQPVTDNTGVLLSIDQDASALTGSVGTPDAYVLQQNLGSEVEIIMDSTVANVFSVPDLRTDIYPALTAFVGDPTALNFPRSVSDRTLPVPALVAEIPTTASGNSLIFRLPLSALAGNARPTVAALALSNKDIEPTDRVPNQGKVDLSASSQILSIVSSQRVCQGDTSFLCLDDAECGASGPCIDVDTTPPAGVTPSILPQLAVYLRTQDGGPQFVDWERGFQSFNNPSSLFNADSGGNQHNDLLDRLFPPGNRPLGGVNDSKFNWFTRDLLHNFSTREGTFDPHAAQGIPWPDVDLYYFVGGQGDRAIVDITTADAGVTFDSRLELYQIPLNTSALDPSNEGADFTVQESDLFLVATNDDKGAADKDARLDLILPFTSIYVVRLTHPCAGGRLRGDILGGGYSSCASQIPNASQIPYTLYHQSLRPDEVSIPLVYRDFPILPSGGKRITGINVNVTYDPSVVFLSGIDVSKGLKIESIVPSLSLSSATELVAEAVAEVPGLARIAFRSFQSNEFQNANGLNNVGVPFNTETPLARIRFRAAGVGQSKIEFAANPTTTGEQLLNLTIDERVPGFLADPFNGYGPGVIVSVTSVIP